MSPNAPSPSLTPARWPIASVWLTTLAWWTWTDRLDLPKTAVLAAAGAVAAVSLRSRWSRDSATAGTAGALLLVAGMLVAPAETLARVEGWAPWFAALACFELSRHAGREEVVRAFAILAIVLAGIGLTQACGVGASVRPIGTLGGPAHFGVTLALLLPWVIMWARTRGIGSSLLTGVAIGAVLLSGSRTAWAMSLPAVALLARRVERRRLWTTIATALVLTCVVDRAFSTGMGNRVADLSAPEGTAAGRVYLWRVYATNATDALRSFSGPEGFVRTWPRLQAAYLENAPADAHFRSDLRHAHADIAELVIDYGVLGMFAVALGSAWLLRRFRHVTAADDPALASLATLTAVVLGGLAMPILFFAPTLVITAAAAGVLARPGSRRANRVLRIAAAAGVVVAMLALGPRVSSELARSAATRARLDGRTADAARFAHHATDLDSRNPRAWIEEAKAAATSGDLALAHEALQQASRDLPNDEIIRAMLATREALETTSKE